MLGDPSDLVFLWRTDVHRLIEGEPGDGVPAQGKELPVAVVALGSSARLRVA
jgi:hypothetical protein